MSKKVKIIFSSCVILLVAVVVTTAFVLTAPRKLKNLVSLKNIEQISYQSAYEDDSIVLNDEQIDQFYDLINKTKYKCRKQLIKSANSWCYIVRYKDGSEVLFGYYIFQSKKAGEKKHSKSLQYILSGALSNYSFDGPIEY